MFAFRTKMNSYQLIIYSLQCVSVNILLYIDLMVWHFNKFCTYLRKLYEWVPTCIIIIKIWTKFIYENGERKKKKNNLNKSQSGNWIWNHIPNVRFVIPGNRMPLKCNCRISTSWWWMYALLQRCSSQLGDGQFGGGQNSLYDIGFGGNVPNTAISEYVRVGWRAPSAITNNNKKLKTDFT